MQAQTSSKVEKFLASPEGERFTKLAGLLGSEHRGERANAAAMANRLLREADLTWGEVIGGSAPARGSFENPTDNMLAKRLEAVVAINRKQGAEIDQLKAEIEKLKNPPKDFRKRKAPGVDWGTANAGKAYETDLQRDLNEAIDQIESAIELNDWERQFLTSIRDIKWKISPKQWARLKILADQAGLKVDVAPI